MTLSTLDVAILCGGTGAKMLTLLETPKALAPIYELSGKRVFLDYLVNELRNQGATRIILLAAHRADDIAAWAKDRARKDIVVSKEKKLTGTAGAVRAARALFKTDRVLVCNGDTLTNIKLDGFLAGGPTPRHLTTYVWGQQGRIKATGHRLLDQGVLDDLERSGEASLENFLSVSSTPTFINGHFHDMGSPTTYKRTHVYLRNLGYEVD